MNQCGMRYFNCAKYGVLLGLFFLTLSLKSQTSELPLPWSKIAAEGQVYDMALDYKDQHVSGLLVVKWVENQPRVVLVSKVGFTLMDFVLTTEDVQWNKKPPGLDRKSVLRNLEKDFRLLLLTPLHEPEKIKDKGRNRYHVKKAIRIAVELSSDEKKVISGESKGFINLFKSFATFTYTDTNPVPSDVDLRRRFLKMNITLKKMDN